MVRAGCGSSPHFFVCDSCMAMARDWPPFRSPGADYSVFRLDSWRAGSCDSRRRRADSFLGSRATDRLNSHRALCACHEPNPSDAASFHPRRLFSCGERRAEAPHPGLLCALRPVPWWPCHRHRAGLRFFHILHGRFGRHHSCAGRSAHAGARGRKIFRERFPRAHDWRRIGRTALASMPAAYRLCHCGQGPHRADVSRRHSPCVRHDGRHGNLGHAPGTSNGQREIGVRLEGSASRAMGCQMGAFMPILAFIGLFSGLSTPVEAAALTALYAFLIATVIHRELNIFRDVPRVMAECGLLIGGVLLILGVSLGFTNYLVDAEIPARAVEWTTRTIHSPIVFLFLLNLFLLVVGCLMEIYPAIVVEVPLLVPLGAAFGIDPIRLGIIFLANMELGYLTPPVGLNLLMSSYRFRKPVPEVLRAVLPVIVVLAMGVLLITYIPALTTALPRWLGR